MKKYDVMLQGGLKLTVNEAEKQSLEKAMLKGESIVTVGNNKFKSSIIKGIFEIKEEVRDNKEAWLKSNREWNEECEKLSKRSIADKITSEMVVRIFPGLKLGNIVLTDAEVAVLEANIKAYFDTFPRAPRCPMRIWWPMIADKVAPETVIKNKDGEIISRRRPNPNMMMGKWWKYVDRNDGAIQEWQKYQQ